MGPPWGSMCSPWVLQSCCGSMATDGVCCSFFEFIFIFFGPSLGLHGASLEPLWGSPWSIHNSWSLEKEIEKKGYIWKQQELKSKMKHWKLCQLSTTNLD